MILLPAHPQPLDNEVFSSWMVRLAFANGLPLHTFYSAYLGYKEPIWSRDIDRHPSHGLLNLVSKCSGQSIEKLKSLTLISYEGVLFEQLPLTGNASWVLPVGLFHRTRQRAGMQFCPLCLRDDVVPYYRRYWRLALYAMCEHHLCIMMEYCPSCHTPVAFHRHGIGRGKGIAEKVLKFCHCCGLDLSLVSPEHIYWSDARSFSMLVATIKCFERPQTPPWHLFSPCGVPFFQGLRVLIGVINGRNGHGFRQQLGKIFGIRIGTDDPKKHFDFECMDAKARLILVLATFWLIDDWPRRFLRLCTVVGFTRSRLTEDFRSLPFWLAQLADEYLDNRPYVFSSTEIIAAGYYLTNKQKAVTWQSLGATLGLPRDSAKAAWKIWTSRSL